MAKILEGPYLSSMCLELSLCMKAGISLSEGIYMLSQDEENKEIKKMLSEMYEKLEGGESFGSAMRQAGCFPKYVIDMIEIGSKTGRLEAVLKALSNHYYRQEQISYGIRNAVVYPFALLLMLLLVIIILLTQVLPIFNDVFNQLGAQMSGVAVSMMNLGQGITKYAAVILAVIVVLVLIGVLLGSIPSMRVKFGRFWNKITAKRSVSKKIASARFASAMAMTLASGLDTDESMDMVENITENPVMKAKIADCKKEIQKGKLFTEAVADAEIFPPLYCRMLSIGYKTGTADTVMDEIARRTEEDVDESIERILNRVEPTLVIIMSLIVGLILLSVMLPLMSIMTTIG